MQPWFAPLFGLLADQPAARLTLTLTLNELVVLVGEALPASAFIGPYWRARGPTGMARRLETAGWRVAFYQQQGCETTLTFARLPLVAPAE